MLRFATLHYKYTTAGDEVGITATHRVGRIKEFTRRAEDWPAYLHRLEQCLFENEMKATEAEGDSRKAAVVFTVIGSQTYKLLRRLVAPCRWASRERIQGVSGPAVQALRANTNQNGRAVSILQQRSAGK